MNVTAPHEGTDAVSTDAGTADITTLPADPILDGEAATCCGTAAGGIGRSEAEALAAQLAAVADPVRLQVLSILANATGGEVCACDFVGPIGKSQPTISHHLKVLAESGLVQTERRGRWVWYRLADQGLDGLMDAVAAATSRD